MSARKPRMKLAVLSAVLAIVPLGAAAQQIPPGVYSPGTGPFELCGLTAGSVAELRRDVEADERFVKSTSESNRFELFDSRSDEAIWQLVFTLPGQAAYPAATCRHVYLSDGRVRLRRSMRCEGTRADCDALYLEFQELDAAMLESLRNGS